MCFGAITFQLPVTFIPAPHRGGDPADGPSTLEHGLCSRVTRGHPSLQIRPQGPKGEERRAKCSPLGQAAGTNSPPSSPKCPFGSGGSCRNLHAHDGCQESFPQPPATAAGALTWLPGSSLDCKCTLVPVFPTLCHPFTGLSPRNCICRRRGAASSSSCAVLVMAGNGSVCCFVTSNFNDYGWLTHVPVVGPDRL